MTTNIPPTPDYVNDILAMATPSLDHHIFKTKYLPLMFNANPDAFNITWIEEVALSPHSKVNIVDKSGKIVYTTPPLCDSTTTSLSPVFRDMILQANIEGNMHVGRGIIALNAVIPLIEKLLPSVNVSNKSAWHHILEQEGYGEVIDYEQSQKGIESTDDAVEINYSDDGW